MLDDNFLFLQKYKPSVPLGRTPMQSLRKYLENVNVSTSSLSPFRQWYQSLSLDQLFEIYLLLEDIDYSPEFPATVAHLSDEQGEEGDDDVDNGGKGVEVDDVNDFNEEDQDEEGAEGKGDEG